MILKVILLIFIFGLLFIVLSIARIFHSFKSGLKQMRDQMNVQNPQYRGNNCSNSKEQTVVDKRNSDEANRKIFHENEGEYVDFEEQKEL